MDLAVIGKGSRRVKVLRECLVRIQIARIEALCRSWCATLTARVAGHRVRRYSSVGPSDCLASLNHHVGRVESKIHDADVNK